MRSLPSFLRPVGAAVLGCLLTAPVAFASGSEDKPLHLDYGNTSSNAASSHGPGGGSIVRTIIGLLVVIGVIYGLTWVLKQVKASKAQTATGGGLETLATLPLGTNRTLHLVRAGEEVVLLGSGEAGVTPIRTYGEAEARALGLLEDELPGAEVVAPEGFMARLRARTVIR
jgi:flagellar protein FliO/FliZ